MELCGHTMGTPAHDLLASIDLFAELGLTGVEIRCAVDGHLDPETLTPEAAARIRDHAQGRGVRVVCLTPYYKDFASAPATAATLEGFRACVRAAQWLDCGLVRALAGIWPVAGRDRKEVRERTIAGLCRAGDIAAEAGVKLALENHIGTLAMAAEETAELIAQVGHPSVGVLLDPYWNVVAGDTDLPAVVRRLAPYLLHCHVKNLLWEGGKHRTVLADEGVIDWRALVGELDRGGYQGFLSDEYEKFWKPEFPEPEVGMAHNARHLRACLAAIVD